MFAAKGESPLKNSETCQWGGGYFGSYSKAIDLDIFPREPRFSGYGQGSLQFFKRCRKLAITAIRDLFKSEIIIHHDHYQPRSDSFFVFLHRFENFVMVIIGKTPLLRNGIQEELAGEVIGML